MVAGLDSLMNGDWPVNAMVIAGLSKYEDASSNPAAGIPLRTTMSSLRIISDT